MENLFLGMILVGIAVLLALSAVVLAT